MVSFKEGRIPEQKLQDGRLFPKVLVPAHQSQREEIKAVVDSITESRDWLHNELRHCGVLLFKGFAVRSASDFNDFVEALGWEEQPYIGYALRDHVVGRIQTANDGPLDQDIFFHHEMSTMKVWPSKVLFFCQIAPPEGGQTAVVQSHRVAERVETKFPEIVQRLESEGLLCLTTMPKEDKAGGITKRWQSHFGTDDPVEAEKRAAASGTRIQWMEDGSADMILGPLPAIKLFEGYDRKVLFNSVPISTFVKPCTKRFTFCDGSPIPSAMVRGVHKYNERGVCGTKMGSGRCASDRQFGGDARQEAFQASSTGAGSHVQVTHESRDGIAHGISRTAPFPIA